MASEKAHTNQIENILSHQVFDEFESILDDIPDNQRTSHKGYTIDDAKFDLPDLIEVLEESIESGKLNQEPFQIRRNIKKQLNNVKKHLSSLNNNPRNNQLNNCLNSIESLKYQVNNLSTLRKYDELEFNFEKERKELKDLKEEYQSRLNQLEQTEDLKKEINEIKKEAQNAKKNIEETEKTLKEIRNNANEQKSKISQELQEAEDLANEITTKHTSVNEKYAKVDSVIENLEQKDKETDELRTKIDDLTDDAENLLDEAVGRTLGKKFAERKKQLKRPSRFWAAATVASVGALAVGSGFIYQDLSSNGITNYSSIAKVLLLLPLGFLAYFSSKNYGRERTLLEAYSFKSTISLSLRPFKKVLNQQMPNDRKEEVGDFMIDSAKQIYEPPKEIGDNKSQDDNEEDKIDKILSRLPQRKLYQYLGNQK